MSRLLTHEVRVGVLVVVGFALFGWVAFALQRSFVQRGGYELTIVFSHIAGLNERAAVRLSGVKVGEVARIFLRSDNQVGVVVRLQNDVRVDRHSKFIITTQSILAFDKYIEILPPKTHTAWLKPGDQVEGEAPFQVQQMIEGMYDTMLEFREMGRSLTGVLDEDFIRQVEEAMANVSDATKGMKLFVDELASLTSENRGGLERMLQNFVVTSENIKETSERVKVLARTQRLDAMQAKVEQLLGELKEAADTTNRILERVDKEVLGPKQAKELGAILEKSNQLLGDVQKTTDSVKKLSGIKAKAMAEMGYRPSSQTMQTNAFVEIGKDDKVARAGVVDVGEGSKALLQVGRNLGDGQIWAGLREGKVGAGGSYAVSDKLRLDAEVYDPNDVKFDVKLSTPLLDRLSLLLGWVKDTQDESEAWVGFRLSR